MRPLLALFAIAPMLTLPAQDLSAQPGDELIGLWRARIDYGPKLHGSLTIRKSGRGYDAAIDGLHAASAGARELRFDFGRDGSFRGRAEGKSIRGFWIQPVTRGPGQSFATPLLLRRNAAGSWGAQVTPLPDHFTLWLSIFRGSDGTLAAVFRNPEGNSTGGVSRFAVTEAGNSIHFSAKQGKKEVAQEATLLSQPERIRIRWNDAGATLDLTRMSAREAAAFYPRAPGSSAYVYQQPPQLHDGWRTAPAASTGLKEQALQSAVEAIAESDPTAAQPTLMHSILVAHRGKLVLEEYFYGFDRLTPHDIRSAGKTFGSIMLGTAPARAAGLSPESRIYEVMRPLGPFANPDPRKSQITLAHLMTHTSGLACNDNDADSPGNESTMQNQTAEPNWWRYTLNLPQAHNPGTHYAYCSANSNLVGGALTYGTHVWLPELFRRTIAEPLEFGEWHWNLMSNRDGYLGGGAYILPRDVLKVGQMYLDGGVWNGNRIVPAEWVRLSTAPLVEITPQTTGLSEEDFSNFYIRAEDGLAWHLGTLKSAGRTYRTYAATGNGGQILLVIPDADLAVVFTGGNYGQGGVWLRWAQQIVGDKIIPAIAKP